MTNNDLRQKALELAVTESPVVLRFQLKAGGEVVFEATKFNALSAIMEWAEQSWDKPIWMSEDCCCAVDFREVAAVNCFPLVYEDEPDPG